MTVSCNSAGLPNDETSRTAVSCEVGPVSGDAWKGEFHADAPDRRWVADITPASHCRAGST